MAGLSDVAGREGVRCCGSMALGDQCGRLRGEHDEKVQRLNFQLDEVWAIYQATKDLEAAAAKKRQLAGLMKGTEGPLCEDFTHGKTRDKIGAFAGMSGRSISRMGTVFQAADEDPDQFGQIRDNMVKTGRIKGAYNEVKVVRS